MATRVKLVAIVFIVANIILIARLFFWQVIYANQLSAQARLQYQSEKKLNAKRGSIKAADGTWLATNVDSWLLFVSKSEIKDSPRTIANKLAPFLVDDPNDKGKLYDEAVRIEGLITDSKSVWIPVKHKIAPDIKRNIEALSIAGIGFDHEEARFYPEGSSSAQILGFVGKDKDGNDQGYFGIEGYYDLTLAGKPGFIKREANAAGVPIIFGSSKESSAVSGIDLTTFINKTVQMTIEKKLEDAINLYGAKSGSVIVMDPKTGAILGMTAYPSYDPGKYWDYEGGLYKNPIISDAFEPGSIMKPVIMAAGIDSGAIKYDTICDICDGPVKVDKYQIETWNKKYYPNATMTEVIVHSDNVGMTFIGQRMGSDKLYDYLEKFGFGKMTGIDLQGEVSPQMRKKGTWNIVDQATATFGQGIAVTPIQMIRAVGAIANSGKLVRPHIVQKVGEEGDIDISKIEEREIISPSAANDVKEMMVAAVKSGESKWAAPKGFKIAGKTGTAQIPIGGHYDETKTIASFVGFAPADNPEFVMLVTLREPQTSQWGSETAAPLWFSIAKDLFPHLGIQPEE